MNGTTAVAASARVARVEGFALRAPCEPVRTSFGTMLERPALLVRIEDADGAQGWGEVWCNFPACGVLHRAALLRTVVGPALVGAPTADPARTAGALAARFEVLALQSGEPGPFAQVLAGVDQALWDLAARRAGLPLARLLGGTRSEVPAYASGIGPEAPLEVVAAQRARGHASFKLKVGFDAAADLARVAAVRDGLRDGERLMVDANQAWTLDEAKARCEALAAHGLEWIEEPLRADRPAREWHALADALREAVPIAAGENLIGEASFRDAIASRDLGVLQPDVAKWGGVTGCRAVARAALRAGLRYCPHFLGAGVGLAVSAHLLAAVGGDGMLEMDVNPNPLRDALCGSLEQVRDGRVALPDSPGFGPVPPADVLRAYALAP
jgi:L-alanine-DL-glutamate epimerase-like enolase superfamily enzyme